MMDKRKTEVYDDGYSSSGVVIKAVAAASALLLCGSMTACHRHRKEPEGKDIMGNMVVTPPVSDSDISSDDELSLMGEEQYFPVDYGQPDDSYMGDLTVEPADGD